MQSPVPTLTTSLRALDGLLAKTEAHCAAKGIDPMAIFHDRLFPDMLPFWRQVTVACDHAKGAAARLAGQEVPRFEDNEASFADLRARVARTIAFVESVPVDAFAGAEDRIVTMRAGQPQELRMPGARYFEAFAVPNLHFHVATAYNILRHRGVEIGKRDYLGV